MHCGVDQYACAEGSLFPTRSELFAYWMGAFSIVLAVAYNWIWNCQEPP